jgi:hypothetical protein
MKSFYALRAPAAADDDRDTLFVRDGFSWLAFIFPLPWLLFRRLWLVAIAAVLLYGAAIYLAETYRLDALPFAFSFLLSLWVALEGGEARVRKLVAQGWQIDRILAARNLGDAEAIYFAELAGHSPAQTAAPMPVLPLATDSMPSSNVVALGLIGPQGAR